MTPKNNSAEKLEKRRKVLLTKLRNKLDRHSSYKIAHETLNFMREVVGGGRYDNVEGLIALLKKERDELVTAEPNEFVMSNVVLSVLKMIREESIKKAEGGEMACNSTLFTFGDEQASGQKKVNNRLLRKFALAAINEFHAEMETCRNNISAQAVDHVCSADVVMTLGLATSETLQSFFKAARKAHRTFRLLSVDDDLCDSEHTEYLSSVDVFTAMRKTTRVIIAAAAIFPDGSCMAPAGSLAMCFVAKRFCVPVSVCAAFYKITPRFIPDLEELQSQSLGSPTDILPFHEGSSLHNVRVVNPMFDVIPPHLVFLYVSHTTALSPAHVYRQITEYYHPEDIEHMCSSTTA